MHVGDCFFVVPNFSLGPMSTYDCLDMAFWNSMGIIARSVMVVKMIDDDD